MSRIVFTIIALLAFLPGAQAQIAPGHPRLLLEPPFLAALRARANANTPEWQGLKGYCDSFIGGNVNYAATIDEDGHNSQDDVANNYPDAPDIGQGYQGDSYWSALLAESLCYQVEKTIDPSRAQLYGNKAVDIVLKMAEPHTDLLSNRGENPCTDDGYVIRFYGVGFGIAYDWLFELLTSEQRQTIYSMANSWINTYRTSEECGPFEFEYTIGNYYAGLFHAEAAIALATYDENPSAPALWSDWINNQFHTGDAHPAHVGVQPTYSASLTGGGWPDGFNYGPLATLNMSLPVWEVRTATTAATDLVHGSAPYTFPIDAADYLMYFTWPTRDYIDDRDTNYGPGTADPGMFASILANLRYWNAPHANVFQQYANEVVSAVGGFDGVEPWERFMFWDPNGAATPVETLPLSYFATGQNAVAARSDWGRNAAWMSFRAGPYTDNQGGAHEYFDQGGVALVRGNVPMLVNGSGLIVQGEDGDADYNRLYQDCFASFDGSFYSGNKTIFNVFYVRSIDNQSTPEPTVSSPYGQQDSPPGPDVHTHIAAYEDGRNYVYTLATGLEDMYRLDLNDRAQVVKWSREIVYLRPKLFVVYDRTKERDSQEDQFLAFHFPSRPTPTSAPSGSHRFDVLYGVQFAGAVTSVLPEHAVFDSIGMYPKNGDDLGSDPVSVWQLQERPGDSDVDQHWLNVFDLSDSSAAVAPASKLTVTSGSATGVLLVSNTGNNAAVFNTGAASTTIVGTISYSVPTARTNHMITELPPGAGFSITVNVDGPSQIIDVSPGGPFITSPKGVLSFVVDATGGISIDDVIFSDGFQ